MVRTVTPGFCNPINELFQTLLGSRPTDTDKWYERSSIAASGRRFMLFYSFGYVKGTLTRIRVHTALAEQFVAPASSTAVMVRTVTPGFCNPINELFQTLFGSRPTDQLSCGRLYC